MQHCTRVSFGMPRVALRVNAKPHHTPRFADVELRRDVAGLDELVLAPAPRPRFLAERRGYLRIVLREVDQAHVPAHMLVIDSLPGRGIALRPHQLVAR